MAGGKRAWFRRWVANPIATVVLAGMLIADAMTLPSGWPNSTVVGAAADSIIGVLTDRARATDPNWIGSGEIYIVRDDHGVRVLHPDSQSWDELSAALVDNECVVVQCVAEDITTKEGFWAATSSIRFRGVRMESLSDGRLDGDLSWARQALFDESLAPEPVTHVLAVWRDIATADLRDSQVLWGGVAHNALAVLLAAGLLYSLTGWPAWFAAHPISRSARRRLRGLCPACGYDLQGTDGAKCPECGKSEPRA